MEKNKDGSYTVSYESIAQRKRLLFNDLTLEEANYIESYIEKSKGNKEENQIENLDFDFEDYLLEEIGYDDEAWNKTIEELNEDYEESYTSQLKDQFAYGM